MLRSIHHGSRMVLEGNDHVRPRNLRCSGFTPRGVAALDFLRSVRFPQPTIRKIDPISDSAIVFFRRGVSAEIRLADAGRPGTTLPLATLATRK